MVLYIFTPNNNDLYPQLKIYIYVKIGYNTTVIKKLIIKNIVYKFRELRKYFFSTLMELS